MRPPPRGAWRAHARRQVRAHCSRLHQPGQAADHRAARSSPSLRRWSIAARGIPSLPLLLWAASAARSHLAARARSTAGTTATSTGSWRGPAPGPLPSGRIRPWQALVFGVSLIAAAVLVFSARGEHARRPRSHSAAAVLRLHLHDGAEADDVAQHRHRRRRRRVSAPGRLGCGAGRSAGRRWRCSRWCSSGRRRISGHSPCCSAMTTAAHVCRCSRRSSAQPDPSADPPVPRSR